MTNPRLRTRADTCGQVRTCYMSALSLLITDDLTPCGQVRTSFSVISWELNIEKEPKPASASVRTTCFQELRWGYVSAPSVRRTI